MTSAKSVGRIVGGLLLAQGVIAPIVNFGLLAGASAPPGFLANAAGHAMQVRLAALLWLVTGVLTLGAAIVALPVFRQHSERLAFLYFAFAVIGCTTVAIENVTLLHMLSVSQDYAKAGAAKEILQAVGTTARSARIAAHYTNLLVGGISALVLFVTLFRFSLVPRVITGVGLPAIVLQMIAVTMPLLGFPFSFPLLAPIGLAQLALVFWLLAQGFRETTAIAGRS